MRFEILGQIRVSAAGGEATIPARERIVLALLLVHPGGPVTYDRLIRAIWGEQTPHAARNVLQGCVSRLRRQLAGMGADGLILTEPAGYLIRLDSHSLDLNEFRRFRDEARQAARRQNLAEARDRYRAALSRWRGPALDGIDSYEVRRVAAGLDEERIQAQDEHIHVELALGGAGELVPMLTELVQQHPYRESLHAALMLALYRAGRQADALAAYRRVSQVLRDDLGVEPGRQLMELHSAILTGTADIFTGTADSLAGTAGPAEPSRRYATPVTPRELPADVGEFTGRADAISTLNKWLAEGGASTAVVISTIAGTAGVGKTALAVHWAHRVADRFPDGQLYLNLRGYASAAPLRPIEALSALLHSLGTAPNQVPPDEASAERLYRSQLAGKRMLVVLDNANSAEQVRPLLPGTAGCLALITSRDRLSGLMARDGARRLTLDVLSAAESQTLLSRLLGAERACAEPQALAELATLCARLPLALRIAAADLIDQPDRTLAGSVAELAGADRIAKLQVAGDPTSAVRAALDLSYHRIPAPARQLFRRLGLLVSPDVTPAAAAALLDSPLGAVTTHLNQLVAAHLIEAHPGDRFAFHDLLRLYARQLAEAEEDEADRAGASRRLFDYYLYTADAAARLLFPHQARAMPPPPDPSVRFESFDDSDAAIDWLDAERANLVAIIQHAAESAPHALAWQLAGCLRNYFWMRRYNLDWLAVGNAALAAARAENDALAEATALLTLANLHQTEGRNTLAVDCLGKALELAREAGWLAGQVAVLSSLSVAWWLQGELQRAAQGAAEALDLSREHGHPEVRATMLNNLSGIERELGHLKQAAQHNVEALELARSVDHISEGDALHNLSEVCLELGRMDEARRYAEMALAVQERIGDRAAEAISLAALAAVERDAGHLRTALERAHASVALACAIEHPRMEAIAFNTLGSVQLLLGSAPDALHSYQTALERARLAETRFCEIEALIGLARAAQGPDDDYLAWQYAHRALQLSRRAGYLVLEGQSRHVFAVLCLRRGDLERAESYARSALERHRQTGHRPGEARAVAILAQIADKAGDGAANRKHRRAVHSLLGDMGFSTPAKVSNDGMLWLNNT